MNPTNGVIAAKKLTNGVIAAKKPDQWRASSKTICILDNKDNDSWEYRHKLEDILGELKDTMSRIILNCPLNYLIPTDLDILEEYIHEMVMLHVIPTNMSSTQFMQNRQLCKQDFLRTWQGVALEPGSVMDLLRWWDRMVEFGYRTHRQIASHYPGISSLSYADFAKLISDSIAGTYVMVDSSFHLDVENECFTYNCGSEFRTLHLDQLKTIFREEFIDRMWPLMKTFVAFKLTPVQVDLCCAIYCSTREFCNSFKGMHAATQLQNALIRTLDRSVSKSHNDARLLRDVMTFIKVDLQEYRQLSASCRLRAGLACSELFQQLPSLSYLHRASSPALTSPNQS